MKKGKRHTRLKHPQHAPKSVAVDRGQIVSESQGVLNLSSTHNGQILYIPYHRKQVLISFNSKKIPSVVESLNFNKFVTMTTRDTGMKPLFECPSFVGFLRSRCY
jgi:hypothetical protein